MIRQQSPPTLLLGVALAVVSWLLPAGEIGAKTGSSACQNTRYTVVELPFLPTLVASSGVVAGTTELHRAILWQRDSGPRELSVPDGFRYTEPVAITQSGDIVVNALDAESLERRVFVYSTDSSRPAIELTGEQSVAHGAGPRELIVGESVLDGKRTSDAVYWSKRSPHSIGLCCGGTLKAANNAGEMIGDAYDAQGRYHAFLWSPLQGLRMVGPLDRYSSAVAVNDAGHVLLQVGSDAYIDKAGETHRLDLSWAAYNSARGMNNCDFVVGADSRDSEHYRAFLWTPAAGFRDLNSLIPKDSGWTLESATAINDRGDIVGRGDFRHDDHGFLLIRNVELASRTRREATGARSVQLFRYSVNRSPRTALLHRDK